ncbi:Hint domain-containing protein [Acidocella aminolytica]|uniref:Hint domain-containing protein n=1 Tax=Acidocella aminolytica TaxID=33998 RepID=UPI001114DF96|nr:Hint domain-containing protein [Acidocella aminolytica]
MLFVFESSRHALSHSRSIWFFTGGCMVDWTWTGAGSNTDWETPGNWVNNATYDVGNYPGMKYATAVTINSGAIISFSSESIANIATILLDGDVSISGTGKLAPQHFVVDTGSAITLGADVNFVASNGLSLSGTGLAIISGGTLSESGQPLSLSASQTLELSGDAQATFANGAGTGTIVLSGADLAFNSGGSTATIDFADVASGGTANILSVPTYASDLTITNLGYGDQIYAVGDILELQANGGDTYSLIDTHGGSYTSTVASSVVLASGANVNDFAMQGGYFVYTGSAPCFYAGTMIATPSGEVAVEEIKAGDMVLTQAGMALAVRWVGQSTVSTRFADSLRALPVRIKAGALADGVPVRDLLVSPDHALWIDGLLVQAGALVNNVNIIREADVPEIFSYYHLELASHEVLLADGAPAESFVDNVDRMSFSNWTGREEPPAWIPEMACPRAKSARQIPPALRARLDKRAGLLIEQAAA